MASIDQQFVEYIVKTLVNNPDKVSVEREIDEKGVLLSLTVDPEDFGRVVGRRGATAQSIRTLLRALGTKNDARYNLKIVNSDEEGERVGDNHNADSNSEDSVQANAEETNEETTDALAEKTRAELTDLDDLDI